MRECHPPPALIVYDMQPAYSPSAFNLHSAVFFSLPSLCRTVLCVHLFFVWLRPKIDTKRARVQQIPFAHKGGTGQFRSLVHVQCGSACVTSKNCSTPDRALHCANTLPPSPVHSERLPGVFHARPRSVQVDRPPNCNLPTTAGNNTA